MELHITIKELQIKYLRTNKKNLDLFREKFNIEFRNMKEELNKQRDNSS